MSKAENNPGDAQFFYLDRRSILEGIDFVSMRIGLVAKARVRVKVLLLSSVRIQQQYSDGWHLMTTMGVDWVVWLVFISSIL